MTNRDRRKSGPTLKALEQLPTHGTPKVVGADITRATKVAAGTLYPLLGRLEAAGWIVGRWESRHVLSLASSRPSLRSNPWPGAQAL